MMTINHYTKLLDDAEVAVILGLRKQQVRALTESGVIPGHGLIDGEDRWSREELLGWIRSGKWKGGAK